MLNRFNKNCWNVTDGKSSMDVVRSLIVGNIVSGMFGEEACVGV